MRTSLILAQAFGNAIASFGAEHADDINNDLLVNKFLEILFDEVTSMAFNCNPNINHNESLILETALDKSKHIEYTGNSFSELVNLLSPIYL